MNITSHSVTKITASGHHRDGSHWIELQIHERDTGGLIVLFFDGEGAEATVDAYAAAIHGVNEASA